jgi:hypothetical protein
MRPIKASLLLQGELPEWAEDHIRAQWAEIERLRKENEELRKALEAAQAVG